jgi:hypothetical protein
MNGSSFKRAERQQSRLRLGLCGPSGSGKTYTGLRFAHTLAAGGKIAVIDTEHSSASKYQNESPDKAPWQFDVATLTSFSPERYTELILEAGRAGYSVILVDSLSHAWAGKDGALELKDRQGGNQWTAWRTITPIHNRMVDALLQSPAHVIATMRSKMEYIQEQDANGKTVIRKVGLAPVARPGMEYEFDLICDLDWAHIMQVSKSRCPAVVDMVIEKPGPAFMVPVMEWLTSGSAVRYAPPVSLDELVSRYGPEAVLAAAEGTVPSTPEEIAVVGERLAGGGGA